jgi:hypothetical protein
MMLYTSSTEVYSFIFECNLFSFHQFRLELTDVGDYNSPQDLKILF